MLVNRQLSPKHHPNQKSKQVSRNDSRPLYPYNTLALNNSKLKTKTSREGKPKTRTGCITCKYVLLIPVSLHQLNILSRIRRVKCDEGRPFCNRCIKFGTICDGYLQPDSKTAVPARCNILPKGSSIVPRPRQLLSRIHYVPLAPKFDNELEGHFFRLYVQETASQIAGPFKTSLWSRLIPQACEAEPFIRQIVVGISALSEVCKMEAAVGTHDCIKRKTYEYALKQYDKALRGMRDAIANGKHNIRNALLACLLVFCFESLQGDPTSAAKNARSGLVLLAEWMSQRSGPNPDFDFLAAQQKTGGFYGLETELLQAFAALDIQVLFFIDTRSETQHMAFVNQFLLAIKHRMPSRFEGLEQSRDCWILLQRRNYHFNLIAIDALSRPDAKSSNVNKDINVRKLGEWGVDNLAKMKFASSNPQSHESDTLALRAQMESYREDIRRWERASAFIFAKTGRVGTQQEKVIMALLKIHAHLNHVQLAAAFMTSELEYDAFLAEYTAIVELSEEVYPYLASSPSPNTNQKSNTRGLFRFDLGSE